MNYQKTLYNSIGGRIQVEKNKYKNIQLTRTNY